MLPLADLQNAFARALADPGEAAPVVATPRRFAIHRNNVRAGIIGALEARYPAVRRIVGDEFFAGMAAEFTTAHPPRSPILNLYGEEFPDFARAFEPVADVPYLPDVARLEWHRHTAYHAADADPVGSAELAHIPPDRLGDARFRMHPSVRLLRFDWPAHTIWQANTGGGQAGAMRVTNTPEWVLVARPAAEVTTQAIPQGTHDFAVALFGGVTLGEAAESATASPGGIDLQAALATLFSSGAVTEIRRAQ